MIHAFSAMAGNVLALGPNAAPTIDPTGAHAADVAKQAIANIFLAVLAVLGVVALWRRGLPGLGGLGALAVVWAPFLYFPGSLQALAAAVVHVLAARATLWHP